MCLYLHEQCVMPADGRTILTSYQPQPSLCSLILTHPRSNHALTLRSLTLILSSALTQLCGCLGQSGANGLHLIVQLIKFGHLTQVQLTLLALH